jgi:molybdenum-dependent DNA-binding transcriptional regulator ModE
MLSYLLPAKARRKLLELLWRDEESGSVSELARLAGVSFAGAHRELQAMSRAGLVHRASEGGTTAYRANAAHPGARLLKELLSMPAVQPVADEESDAEVRGWLVDLGALLDARRRKAPSPERVLAAAARLSHRDPSVARILPALVWKHRDRLDPDRLVTEARRQGEKQALGFFVEMAAELGGDPSLARWAEPLRDRRVRSTRDFFQRSSSPHARRLAELHTPPAARRWHYRLNIGTDSFEAAFRRHVRAR